VNNLEIVLAMESVSDARSIASEYGGILLADEREETGHLPFASLVRVVTDDRKLLQTVSTIGTYLVCRRVIKARVSTADSTGLLPGAISVSTMVAHPDLNHEQADQHWRDVHAPLALTVHKAMTNYTQLSILHCFTGPEWNGFALCGFDTESDLRDHFFDSPEGKEAIRNDIAKFANTRKSPRRIIAKEYLCQDQLG